MLQTEHYQLNQWDFEDQILMADFNRDNQKTDEALHELAGQVAGKASSSAVSSLTTKVNQKAEQSALVAEQTARQNADSAEQAARIGGDNAEKAAREAAVAELDKRAGAQLIRTETLSSANQYFLPSLKNISWADWREVHLLLQSPGYSGTYSVELNSSGMYLDSKATFPLHIILYPCFTPALHVGGFMHPRIMDTPVFAFDRAFSALEFLSARAGTGALPAGTSATIWGVK